MHLDLPGIEPASIDVTVEKNVLSVHAERRRPTADEVEMLIAERPEGTFSRQLFLGESLDADRLTASYEQGVLTLRVPVAERAKPRRVDVTSDGSASRPIETRAHDSIASGTE